MAISHYIWRQNFGHLSHIPTALSILLQGNIALHFPFFLIPAPILPRNATKEKLDGTRHQC
jgi:hypothetical protein